MGSQNPVTKLILDGDSKGAVAAVRETMTAMQQGTAAAQAMNLGLISGGQNTSDHLQSQFKNLGIRSAAEIEAARAKIVGSFEAIKKSGVATPLEVARAQQAMTSQLQNLSRELEGHNQQTHAAAGALGLFQSKIFMTAMEITALIAVAKLAGEAIAAPFIKAYSVVEEFTLSTTKSAAMMASFMKGGDVGQNFQKGLAYAEALQVTMEEIDAKTIAGGQDLAIINEELIKQRIVLDVSNQRQLDAFTNIANAAAAMKRSGVDEVQVRQEVGALLRGQVNQNSQLASQMNSMVGGDLKRQVELHKQSGDLVEWIGEQLKGWAPASDNLQGTWSAIGSTMKTISDSILRDGFKQGYKDINDSLSGMNSLIKIHGADVSSVVNKGWMVVKGVVGSVWDIIMMFAPELKTAGRLVGIIADGWGMLAAVALPVAVEKMGAIVAIARDLLALGYGFGKVMVDGIMVVAEKIGGIGRMLYNAITGDKEGLQAAVADFAQSSLVDVFRADAATVGEILKGIKGNVASLYNGDSFDRLMAQYQKKAIKATAPGKPDLGDPPPSDDQRDVERTRIEGLLKVRLEGIKRGTEQEVAFYARQQQYLELSYANREIRETEYQDNKLDLERRAIQATVNGLELEKSAILKAGEAKSTLQKEEKDQLKETSDARAQAAEKDREIEKQGAEAARKGLDLQIARAREERQIIDETQEQHMSYMLANEARRREADLASIGIVATVTEQRLQSLGKEREALDLRYTYQQLDLDRRMQLELRELQQHGATEAQKDAVRQEYALKHIQLEQEKAQRLGEIWWNNSQTYIGYAQNMLTMTMQMLLFDEGQRGAIGKRMLASSIRFISQGLSAYMMGKAKEHVLNAAAMAGAIKTKTTQAATEMSIGATQASAWAAYFAAMSLNPFGGQAFIPAATAMTAAAAGFGVATAGVTAMGAGGMAAELGMAAAWGAGGMAVGALGEAGASAVENGASGNAAGYGAGTPGSPVVTQPSSQSQKPSLIVNVKIEGNVMSDDRWVEERLAPTIRDLALNRNVNFGLTPLEN
jgi:hypothetical protein